MRLRLPLCVFLLLAAIPLSAVERVEIVLDASSGMWRRLGDGPPVFVSVRDTMQDYAAAAALRQGRPEVALRIVGGSTSLATDDWCDDTALVATFGVVDSSQCREALQDLQPRGGRPLVRGLNAALDDLAEAQDRRRIVIITSGPDQCHGDIISTARKILEADPPIEIRIIGLGLDQALANAATTLAPTRNLTDAGGLADALKWALQPADTRPTVASPIDMHLTLGGQPLASSAIELTDATGSERAFSTVENGRARVRLAPGRYRATIEMGEQAKIQLAGIVVGDPGQEVEIHLADTPPVTLDVLPEQPVAGGSVHIGFWGSPSDRTWVFLASPESSIGSYITRAGATEGDGDVTLEVPETVSELEARFVFEPLPGIFQLLGTRRMETREPSARLESQEKAEKGKPLEISWTGPGHLGDHITVSATDADQTDYTVCMPVSEESGTLNTIAPPTIGEYGIAYRSAHGSVLAQRPLEVFEVLATLDGPETASPASTLSIEWTGPDANQDFLSLARTGASDDDYLSWTPTASGNPAQLRAPLEPGSFEVRYVRSEDGAVLARSSLEIVENPVELHAPESVVAGTRFDVEWTGTVRSGDFLAVAEAGSPARDSLDFSFASDGSPSNLAAPFKPGDYEVRYVSGSGLEVLAAVPLTVR